MSGDDFNEVFGAPRRADHAERLRGGEAAGSKAPDEATVGSGPYKAYGYIPAGNVNLTCEVTRWVDGTEVPEGIEFNYRFLMQVGFVGEEEIRLYLPDCIVVIEGQRLRDLRKKLARRQVTFIQQHSPRVWPPPPTDDPIINRVTVRRPEITRA